jgi:hypothetical protein
MWLDALCEDLPLPLAHVGDKKVKRFHFSEITGRLPYVRATVTHCVPSTTDKGNLLEEPNSAAY